MARTSLKRINQGAAGGAILCLLLGMGNIIFAGRKLDAHKALIEKATAELRKKENQPEGKSFTALKQPGSFLPAVNLDKEARYIERVRQRMKFYEIVMLGGKILLGASGILTLMAVLFFRKKLPKQHAPPADPLH